MEVLSQEYLENKILEKVSADLSSNFVCYVLLYATLSIDFLISSIYI